MAASYPERMSPRLRGSLMATFGLLWLTGCYWLILHFFFARPSDFGPVQHPWSPLILRIHGWIAVAGVFLLGWVSAGHVNERWSQGVKRVSGISMATLAAVLVLTGYALYYTTDRIHDAAGFVHEILGGAAIVFALVHWRRYRIARRPRVLAG